MNIRSVGTSYPNFYPGSATPAVRGGELERFGWRRRRVSGPRVIKPDALRDKTLVDAEKKARRARMFNIATKTSAFLTGLAAVGVGVLEPLNHWMSTGNIRIAVPAMGAATVSAIYSLLVAVANRKQK